MHHATVIFNKGFYNINITLPKHAHFLFYHFGALTVRAQKALQKSGCQPFSLCKYKFYQKAVNIKLY